MSNNQVGNIYRQIIDEVIESSRVDFEEGGVDEGVLEELRKVRCALICLPACLPTCLFLCCIFCLSLFSRSGCEAAVCSSAFGTDLDWAALRLASNSVWPVQSRTFCLAQLSRLRCRRAAVCAGRRSSSGARWRQREEAGLDGV